MDKKELVIRINLENAAFEDSSEIECQRILKTIRFVDGQRLIDCNGNIVGSVEYK